MKAWPTLKTELGKKVVEGLYNHGMIMTWYRNKPEGWILVSKKWSPYYINLRPISCYPQLHIDIGNAVGEMFFNEAGYEPESKYKLVGVAEAGKPIASAVTTLKRIPSLWTRKIEGVKSIEDFRKIIGQYGQHAMVEGDINNGDVLGIVDDLVTKFDSKEVALEQVRHEIGKRGLQDVRCNDVGVLLDREQGARKRAEELDLNLYVLVSFKSQGIYWLLDVLSPIEREHISGYMQDEDRYQDSEFQKYLAELARKK